MPASTARRLRPRRPARPPSDQPQFAQFVGERRALRRARIPLDQLGALARQLHAQATQLDSASCAARPRSDAFQPGIWARPAAVMPRSEGTPRLVDLARNADQRGQLDAQPLIALVRQPLHGQRPARRPLRSSPPATRGKAQAPQPSSTAPGRRPCPTPDARTAPDRPRRSCAPRPPARAHAGAVGIEPCRVVQQHSRVRAHGDRALQRIAERSSPSPSAVTLPPSFSRSSRAASSALAS